LETSEFIIGFLKRNWNDGQSILAKVFRRFYCSSVRGDIFFIGCVVTQQSESEKIKLDNYDHALLTDTLEWYKPNIVVTGVNKIIVSPTPPSEVCPVGT